MRFARFFAAAAIGTAVLAGAAPRVEAQSLFAGRGLGYVMEPLEARARALGGAGLGLPEPGLSLINPAGVAGLPAPTLHVSVQPDDFSGRINGQEFSGSTVRFPVIHAALPFRRWTATLGYASFLDRNWAVESDTTLLVGGTSVGVRDRFASHGGAARLRLGAAYALNQRLAVGAGVDILSGSVQDTVYRIFDDVGIRPSVNPSSLGFRGVGYTAGARWVPSEAFAMDASVSGGGQIEVRSEFPAAATRSYDLPITFAGGVSGRITPSTLLALNGRWAGWSTLDGALAAEGGARDTWSVGGGVEWDALRVANRPIPLRLGARQSLLPFRWDAAGADWASERAVTLGGGVRLGGGAASLDFGAERGTRGGDAAGLTEDFWRMVFSLTVLGR